MDDQFKEAKKWLAEFQQDSSKEVSKNLGLLLGEELSISMQEWSIIERDRTLPIFSLPLCTSTVQISKSYEGSGIFIFQKRTAILLSGILSMYNKTVLDEKLETGEMDEADMDAFGEICNQLIGSLDRIATDLLPDKVHFQQKDTFLWERKKEMQFPFEDTHLIVFPYSAEIKDRETIKFQLILPGSIINKFLELQVDWSFIYQNQEAELELPEEQEQTTDEIQSLFIRLHSDCDSSLQTILDNHLINYSFVDSFVELNEQILQNSIKLIVLQVEGKEKQGIAMCSKISKDLEGYHIPIWIQGKNWDQNLVTKARKAGASYLTLIPSNSAILESKIHQTFQ